MKRNAFLCLAGLVGLWMLSAVADAEQTWPGFRHDRMHTGRTTAAGPRSAAQSWSWDIGAPGSSPVSADGKVYAAGGGKVFCWTTDGALLWTYDTGGSTAATPCVGTDGAVYTGSSNGYVYALSATGALRWKRNLSSPVDASPTLASDGTLYAGTRAGKLYALKPDGTIKFTFTAGGVIASSCAIGTDGTVYFGCDNGKVYALKPDGTAKWTFAASPTAAFKSSPAIADDGTVYIGSMGGALYAIWPDGRQRFRYLAGGVVYSSPAVASDGSIYFGARDGFVYCLAKTGILKWKLQTGGWVDSSPAVDSQGVVYVGSNGGRVYAVNPDGTVAWFRDTGAPIESSPAIGELQTLFVVTASGKLCSFGIDTTPPTTPVVTDSGIYSTEPNTLRANWTSVDPESGIASFEYAIGTTPGGTDLVPFTNAGQATQMVRTDLPLVNGATYYMSVRATNAGGLVSDIGVSDGIKVDFTPPASPYVIDDGDFTNLGNALHFAYASGDVESGIARYEYCIGTAPDAGDALPWTDAGTVKEQTVTGLALAHGKTYTISVRAYNHAGLAATGHSNGILVDLTKPEVTIQAAASNSEIRATINATDPESGIKSVEYVLLKSPDVPAAPQWQSADPGKEIVIPGTYDLQQTYYVAARALNHAGSWSDIELRAATHTGDTTPPSAPVVIDDGEYTCSPDTLHASWSARDDESGISEYQYCLGTAPGKDDLIAWKSAGTSTQVSVGGLSLQTDIVYYFSANACNGAGMWGPVGSSDGIEYRLGASTWPRFRHDLQGTGCAQVIGPVTPQLKWRQQAQGYVESSAAVGADGAIYVGASDGKLYSITPSGTVKWAYQTGSCIDSSPAVGQTGCVYVGSYDGYLYCLYSTGILRWRYLVGSMVWSSPCVTSDGTVYFGAQDGAVYALNADGALKWRYLTGGAAWSSPCVGADGSVYVGSGDGRLYCLNAGGGLRWYYQTGSAVDSSPAIGSDGVVYFGSGDGFIYAMNPTGSRKWQQYLGRIIDSSPAVTPDGRIYVGTGVVGSDGALHAFDKTGKQLWRIDLPAAVRSSPAVDQNGNIFVGCADGKVIALTPSGAVLWQYKADQSILSSPALCQDGSLVVGTDSGGIYCLRNAGAPDSTPPTVPLVTVDRQLTTVDVSVKVSWSSSDPESGIQGYSYAVGSQPGACDAQGWTDAGTATSVTLSAPLLAADKNYYASVIARNNAGMSSPIGTSGCVAVVAGSRERSVGTAKRRAEGTRVLFDAVVVGVYDDCVFVEDPNRCAGIRCMVTGSSLTPGSTVSVSGVLSTRYGEPMITSPVFVPVLVAGGIVKPLLTRCDLDPGLGVDKMGLLVRLAGRVTKIALDLTYMIITDGSYGMSPRGAPGVEVRLSVPSDLKVGSYVGVNGIVCKEVVSSRVVPVLRGARDPQLTVYCRP